MLKSPTFIFFHLFLATLGLSAQNPYIQHFTTFEGLPSNTVYQVYQDSHNFIWFATDAGVARYDGTQFTYYQKKDGLNSNEVIRIKEDVQGRIWFFHLNAAFNFFFQNKIFNQINAPFLDSLKSTDLFRDFFQDEDLTIYFYRSLTQEIFTLDKNNKVKKYLLPSRMMNFPSEPLWEGMLSRYFNKSSTGEFLLWTRVGIFSLKNLGSQPRIVCDSFYISRVFPAANGSCYALVFFPPFNFPHPKPPLRNNPVRIFKYRKEFFLDSLTLPINSSQPVSFVLEDDYGFIWVSTFDQGVYCVKKNRIVRHFDIKEAQSIIQDHEKNIWITSMKDGVYKISHNLNIHKHYESSLFQNSAITALYPDPLEGIWCTNGKAVYLLKNGVFSTLDFRNSQCVFNQLYYLKNNTLIAGEKSYFYYAFKDIKRDFTHKRIYYFKNSSNRDGFKRITVDESEQEIATFAPMDVFILRPDKLFVISKVINAGERIYNLFYNSDNNLIINGKRNFILLNGLLKPCKELSCFNEKMITDHLIINRYTELFNIEGDSIYLMYHNKAYNLTSSFSYPIDLQINNIVYKEPVLYLSTNRNVYYCDNPLNLLLNKPTRLNPIDISFRNIHDILFQNDSLYVASDDGLTVIPEKTLQTRVTNTPIPYFQSIQIEDKEVDLLRHTVTFTGNKRLKFDFSCINYSYQPVIFSYRLEKSDTAWTTGTSKTVVYQRLSPGDYVFWLRVRKSTTPWSQPIAFEVHVKATLLEQPLTYVFLILLVGGGIAIIIIRRKNFQIRRREIDHQLITLEQKALQSMMNPHFIFNALGSIQSYLLQNKAGEAGLYLSQFARLIRQNLTAINSAVIILEDEIDRLKNYLDLERLRMENKFDYTIIVDETVEEDEVLIPSMIIQPFVENSIWHGISGIEEMGQIDIFFSMSSENALRITIEDNGVGIIKSKTYVPNDKDHLHIGIEMTRKRLEIIGRRLFVKTSVSYSEQSPGIPNPGTRVDLIVPVTYSEVGM
ncbi:MAG: histidine kinase [Bacteroidetes bacterium]|nr:histidine kinase [Bacteroidota bacterium]